jgi:hypothetical protein
MIIVKSFSETNKVAGALAAAPQHNSSSSSSSSSSRSSRDVEQYWQQEDLLQQKSYSLSHVPSSTLFAFAFCC